MKANGQSYTVLLVMYLLLFALLSGCISKPLPQPLVIRLEQAEGEVTDTPLPPEPAEVHSGSEGCDYTTINWAKVEGADAYNLYMKTDNSDWKKVTTVYAGENREEPWYRVDITGLKPATAYTFRVTSVNANGESRGIFNRQHTNYLVKPSQPDQVDIFTPDNSFSTAYAFKDREQHYQSDIRTICPAGDADYYQFRGKAGNLYSFKASKLSFKDNYLENMIIMTLYDENLNPLEVTGSGEGETRLSYGLTFRGWNGLYEIEGWVCPADGIYYMQVQVHETDEDGLARYVYSTWFDERRE